MKVVGWIGLDWMESLGFFLFPVDGEKLFRGRSIKKGFTLTGRHMT